MSDPSAIQGLPKPVFHQPHFESRHAFGVLSYYACKFMREHFPGCAQITGMHYSSYRPNAYPTKNPHILRNNQGKAYA